MIDPRECPQVGRYRPVRFYLKSADSCQSGVRRSR